MTRCTIVAIGPRGDVQPMLALGVGLRDAGLEVRFATHADFAPAAQAARLELQTVQGDAGAFFGGPAGVAVRDRVADPRAFRTFFDRYLTAFYDKLLVEVSDACADADVVIAWPWTRFVTALAEAFRIPVFIACPYPPLHLPTRAFPNPFQDRVQASTPREVLRSWRAGLPMLQMGDASLNRWREDRLGLKGINWRDDLRRLRHLPHLLGFSTSVLPRPADWAPWIEVTGFWFLEKASDYVPPPALAAFLAEGEPPVAIGFSSQVVRDGRTLADSVVEAVHQAGVRAVLLSGFGGLAGVEPGGRVFSIESVPYDWLFPRCAAVVHHGGSGSTGETLRAGLPGVAVTFGYDQPLWGERVRALGAAAAPIPARELTPDRLAAALGEITRDGAMRARAQALGRTIRDEHGVRAAVARVLSSLDGRGRGPS